MNRLPLRSSVTASLSRRPFVGSLWGRSSRRRSSRAGRGAPRLFPGRRGRAQTETVRGRTRKTRFRSSRCPTAAAWRSSPCWGAFCPWSFAGGTSSLWEGEGRGDRGRSHVSLTVLHRIMTALQRETTSGRHERKEKVTFNQKCDNNNSLEKR